MSSILPSFSQHLEEEALETKSPTEDYGDLSAADLVRSVGKCLPIVESWNLEFDKSLGSGSYSNVSKEILFDYRDPEWSPYYVAVKRIPTGLSLVDRKRRCEAFARELRVTSHRNLKDHAFITPTIAYGWDQNYLRPIQPFIVTEYSEFGTVTQYLRKFKPGVRERRDIVFDVARGLQSLHECKIIHGDLTPSNIIISNCLIPGRNQKARLADFGASIFETDAVKSSYLGTPLYNAPEIQCSGHCSKHQAPSAEGFYAADVYSFGLTMWNIMKCGESFVDVKSTKQPLVTALDWIYHKEQDGLLALANDFCRSSCFDEAQDVAEALKQIFKLCLREDPAFRSTISEVVIILSRGTSLEIPLSPFPTIKSCPRSTREYELSPLDPSDQMPRRRVDEPLVTRASKTVAEHMARPKREYEEIPESLWITRIKRPRAVPTSIAEMENFDVAELSETTTFPWDIQKQLVDKFRTEIKVSKKPSQQSHALLQLGLCYYMGFGVSQNIPQFLDLLKTASADDYTASALLSPVCDALDCRTEQEPLDGSTVSSELKVLNAIPTRNYFGARIRHYQRQKNRNIVDGECRHLGHVINPRDRAVISQIVRRINVDPNPALSLLELKLPDGTPQNRHILVQLASIGAEDSLQQALQDRGIWGPELSWALNEACKCGHFEAAKVLASNCSQLHISEDTPSPLHWLIMFPPAEATVLLEILLGTRSSSFAALEPLCGEFLDFMPETDNSGLYFPEHCLQLFGTPLHWAVRTRNIGLVEGLLEYGADINQRWQGPQHFHGDVIEFRDPWTSPLDLAVQYHMPEIVDFLLSKNASVLGTNFREAEHHCLFMVGRKCLPLSRHMIHGRAYSCALRETLSVLTEKYALDINWQDSNGYTSLLAAVTNPNHERYVVEELLRAGARADICTNDGENIAFLMAGSGTNTPTQVSTFELVAPQLGNINALNTPGLDKECHNALHICAIFGNSLLAKSIVNVDGAIVDFCSSRNSTALDKAAARGHTEVVRVLVAAGADLSARNGNDYTALESAITNRKVETALVLLEADAPTAFRCQEGIPTTTVLHLASARPPDRESILGPLLNRSDKLRGTDQLNAYDLYGYTPLHTAARNGDVAGVKSLIEYGADPLNVSKRRDQIISETARKVSEEMLDRAQTNRLYGGLKSLSSKREHEMQRLIQRYKEISRILWRAEAGTKKAQQDAE